MLCMFTISVVSTSSSSAQTHLLSPTSSSLDHGSKFRGPSPNALVQLNSATLIFNQQSIKSPTSLVIPPMSSESEMIITISTVTTFTANSLNASVSFLQTETCLFPTHSEQFAISSAEIKPSASLPGSTVTISPSQQSI
ncbi:hypothetical protein TNCV_4154241 [Trichonephila clavipes]|nr:hypothetical protein TNCV_4154241 [Trichonephila clavipes]